MANDIYIDGQQIPTLDKINIFTFQQQFDVIQTGNIYINEGSALFLRDGVARANYQALEFGTIGGATTLLLGANQEQLFLASNLRPKAYNAETQELHDIAYIDDINPCLPVLRQKTHATIANGGVLSLTPSSRIITLTGNVNVIVLNMSAIYDAYNNWREEGYAFEFKLFVTRTSIPTSKFSFTVQGLFGGSTTAEVMYSQNDEVITHARSVHEFIITVANSGIVYINRTAVYESDR